MSSQRRLLVLATPPVSAAATRFRAAQFFPMLRRAGIEPDLRPFFDEPSFASLYRRGSLVRKAAGTTLALLRRLRDIIASRSASGVFIQREAALVGPPLVEIAIQELLDVPSIFDLDDAIWVPYTSPTYGSMLSQLLKAPDKAERTARSATRVFAGNEYLATWARSINPMTSVFPTVVDTEVFRPRALVAKNAIPVIGWIGTHSTIPYLESIAPALRKLAVSHRFKLRVIGGRVDIPEVEVEHRPWRLETEAEDFRELDIGLYPLLSDDWALGKSGFKAVQYMASGVPFIASPVGVTTEMVASGTNGYLASSPEEWVEKLSLLLESPSLRSRLGEGGRALAVDKWSLAAHGPRWVEEVSKAIRR